MTPEDPSPAAEEVRARQLHHWNHVAPGWERWLEWMDRNFLPVGEWCAAAAGWSPGVAALDVACGAGFPALLGATRLLPGGTLTVVDISAGMVARVLGRARASGVEHLAGDVMDAEHLRFGDASFDAVTNVYGLMFCPDPDRAAGEMHRVLRPGGRCAIVTWAEPAASPFFSVILPIAASALGVTAPEVGAPGPFRFATSPALDAVLRRAGFSDVRVERLAMTVVCESVARYCEMFGDLAWASQMQAATPAVRSRFEELVAAAARPFERDGRLELVATSMCASGCKRGAVTAA